METENQTERFVQLQTGVQGRLYGYIRTLVPDAECAKDVLQETNLVLWRKSAEFVPGTSFDAWCSRVAYFQAKAFLRERYRDRHVFNDQLLEQLSTLAEREAGLYEDRQRTMLLCLEKLPQEWRELIRQRYSGMSPSIADLAGKVGRSAGALRKIFHRARRALLICIDRTLAREGHP